MRIANDRPGQRILEVGVGTGLSLPYFRTDSRMTGVDISAEMLEKARRRVERKRLANVDGLHVMDAEHLEFEDNSFDAVLALYVASVVPSPARFAAEMRRVCIPGGTIVLVNHFTSENWALRFMEKRLAHLARHIGFHADFPLDTSCADSGLAVREIRPSNLFGYWRLLRCINEKPASEPALSRRSEGHAADGGNARRIRRWRPDRHREDEPHRSLAAIADPSAATGIAFVRAPEMRALLEAAGFADWDGFAASWDDLGVDMYMVDGGRYRRRRFACFRATREAIARKPHQPHYQSRDYNPLNGGIERRSSR